MQGKYFEAVCSEVDPEKQQLVACFPADTGMDEFCFKLDYDILILGQSLRFSTSPSMCLSTMPSATCPCPHAPCKMAIETCPYHQHLPACPLVKRPQQYAPWQHAPNIMLLAPCTQQHVVCNISPACMKRCCAV